MEPRRPESTPLLRIVASAALTAAYTAVPDYATTRRQQRLVRAGLASAALGAGVVAFLRTDREEAPQEGDGEAPRLTRSHAAVVAAAVPLSVVSYRSTRRVNHALVERLQSRGVRRPWTWVGLGWAVGSVGLELLDLVPSAD